MIGRRIALLPEYGGRIHRVRPFVILALMLPVAAIAAPPSFMPREVARFLERRMDCDHWAGEEPYDAARRREIEANIRDLRCEMIERDEKRLRKRYAGKPAVLRMLGP